MSGPISAARRAAVALILGALLTGCADIPTTGDPERVRAEGVPAQAEPQVRVIAQGPRPSDSPVSIVSGFLEASGTTEAGFATARQFLAPDGASRWTARGITIYDQDEFSLVERTGARVVLTTVAVGRVDDQGVYVAESTKRAVQVSFDLVRLNSEWRIAAPPPGLLVSQQDFEREYLQIENYYIARPPRTSVLVPDPVYTPRTQASPTGRLESLLRGPSRWLSAVAMTAAPAGAELTEPVTIRSGVALVRLSPESLPIGGVERDLMLAQIVMTLTQDPEITQVEVRAAEAPPLSFGDAGNTILRRQDVVPYLPADLRPPAPPAYFVRGGAAFTVGPGVNPGPFPAETELAEIAVSPGDGTRLAGISADRTTLWTARSEQPKELTVRASGVELRSLTFDGDGNLWVVEGVGKQTVVRRYPPGGNPLRAGLTGFEARQISRLRVAADGVRLAMVLDTIEGSQIYLAQVSESASGLRIAAPRRMAAALADPRSVDWADPGHLVVLAAQPNAQPQPFEVSLGGPVEPFPGTPPPGMTEISKAYGQPMIASTRKEEIYRLREDGTWFKEGAGTAPTYPG